MISRLVAFKNLYDADAPLEEVLPATLSRYPLRYAGYTLQRLCDEMHSFYREHDIASLQRLCFRAERFPEQAMTVQEATERFVTPRQPWSVRCATATSTSSMQCRPAKRRRRSPSIRCSRPC